MACAGFILAGAEKVFRGGRLAPPPVFCSAPGAEQTRGGAENLTLLYLEKEGETFNDRTLSNPKLTVLFFF